MGVAGKDGRGQLGGGRGLAAAMFVRGSFRRRSARGVRSYRGSYRVCYGAEGGVMGLLWGWG